MVASRTPVPISLARAHVSVLEPPPPPPPPPLPNCSRPVVPGEVGTEFGRGVQMARLQGIATGTTRDAARRM